MCNQSSISVKTAGSVAPGGEMIDQQQSLHTAKGKEKVRSTAKATMAGSEVPALMQLHEIQSKYLADLVFLHAEFTKVKNHLPSHQTLAGDDDPQGRLMHFLRVLENMVRFCAHLQGLAVERQDVFEWSILGDWFNFVILYRESDPNACRSNSQITRLQKPIRDPIFYASLESLEADIVHTVLPVKARLLAQLQRDQCAFVSDHRETLVALGVEGCSPDWTTATAAVKMEKDEAIPGEHIVHCGPVSDVRAVEELLSVDCLSDEGSTSNDSMSSFPEEVLVNSAETFRKRTASTALADRASGAEPTRSSRARQRQTKRNRGATSVPHHATTDGCEGATQKNSRKKARSASSTNSHILDVKSEVPAVVCLSPVSGTRTDCVEVRQNDEVTFEENGAVSSDMQRRKSRDESRRRRQLNHIVPHPRKLRDAEYTCSKCTETYKQVVQDNPWWALYAQHCPKCNQVQVPRIDITAETNSIEADPNFMALYGEGLDESSESDYDSASEYESDEDAGADTEASFPFGRDGLLSPEEASRLLVLMSHARTCGGVHTSPEHQEVCRATKFLMLHIRDCPGISADGTECPLRWCNPCKKMLAHLTRCYEPSTCTICNPYSLPDTLRALHSLNLKRGGEPGVCSSSSEMEVTVEDGTVQGDIFLDYFDEDADALGSPSTQMIYDHRGAV